jgi:hypothetical protein
VDRMGEALPRLLEIGGSHAQRDFFMQVHLDAMIHCGKFAAAQNVLQPLLRAQPASHRLKRLATHVHAALGLPALLDA